MGKINQGLFGGFLNKTGNLVGGTWKGISTVRIYQPNVSNPRTTAQVNQRNKMAAITYFASFILVGIIKPMWDRFASKMSGYNDFIRNNMSAVDTDGNMVYNNLIISKGNLDGFQSIACSADVSAETVTITATALPQNRYGAATDIVYALVVDEDTGLILYADSTGQTRGTAIGGLVIPNVEGLVAGNSTKVYVALRRADGTMVSDTSYDTIVPVA